MKELVLQDYNEVENGEDFLQDESDEQCCYDETLEEELEEDGSDSLIIPETIIERFSAKKQHKNSKPSKTINKLKTSSTFPTKSRQKQSSISSKSKDLNFSNQPKVQGFENKDYNAQSESSYGAPTAQQTFYNAPQTQSQGYNAPQFGQQGGKPGGSKLKAGLSSLNPFSQSNGNLLASLLPLFLITGGLAGSALTAAGASLLSGSTGQTINVNVTTVALNNVTVINNSTSSGAAVDLAPITALLNQILTLLNTIIGLLPPIGRSFDSWGHGLAFVSVLSGLIPERSFVDVGKLWSDLWMIGPLTFLFWLVMEWNHSQERQQKNTSGQPFQEEICARQAIDVKKFGQTIIIPFTRYLFETWKGDLSHSEVLEAIQRGIELNCGTEFFMPDDQLEMQY